VETFMIRSLLLLVLVGCDSTSEDPQRFVLVHGAWMGAWAYDGVAAELRSRGHAVEVVELPAHGADPGTIADASLDAYVARVLAPLDRSSEPAVLVGHSMGGLVISGAAEARPQAISRLVYVAAFLPKSGDSLFSLALTDADSQTGGALTDDGSDGTLDIRSDALVSIFCADCDAAAQATLAGNYRTEPALPLTQTITLGAAFDGVPRAYAFTTDDRAVSRAFQGRMVDASPVIETAELATSHSPFLSAPVETADAIERLAR
jgi:pimeloyl-ACP methyl ester carboxylesterase